MSIDKIIEFNYSGPKAPVIMLADFVTLVQDAESAGLGAFPATVEGANAIVDTIKKAKIKTVSEGCSVCVGTGKWENEPCICVTENAWDRCYLRFSELDSTTSSRRANKNSEFRADFLNLAEDALGRTVNHRVFRWVYLLRADEGMVARRLGVSLFRLRTALTDIRRACVLKFMNLKPSSSSKHGIFPPESY